jgi:nitric oxide reductase NorE protein
MREYQAFVRDPPGRPVARHIALPSVERRRATLDVPTVPGEPGLWILLLGDMTVFALFFGAFLLGRGQHPGEYAASREQLTIALGTLNTIVLLTSSLCVALAVRAHRQQRQVHARRLIDAAALCALAFVLIKGVEWGGLLHHGLTPSTSDFFMFYFVITGVHLLHVLIGLGGLLLMHRTVSRPAAERQARLIVECAGSYWHMVDLLWVVIFPLLYFSAT